MIQGKLRAEKKGDFLGLDVFQHGIFISSALDLFFFSLAIIFCFHLHKNPFNAFWMKMSVIAGVFQY